MARVTMKLTAAERRAGVDLRDVPGAPPRRGKPGRNGDLRVVRGRVERVAKAPAPKPLSNAAKASVRRTALRRVATDVVAARYASDKAAAEAAKKLDAALAGHSSGSVQSSPKRTAAQVDAAESTPDGSRASRWNAAVSKAQVAKSDLDDAIGTLSELRGEFEEWRDNMPESLQGGATYEKLDAVCDLDIDRDQVMDALDWLDEADGLELPLGFGRD